MERSVSGKTGLFFPKIPDSATTKAKETKISMLLEMKETDVLANELTSQDTKYPITPS